MKSNHITSILKNVKASKYYAVWNNTKGPEDLLFQLYRISHNYEIARKYVNKIKKVSEKPEVELQEDSWLMYKDYDKILATYSHTNYDELLRLLGIYLDNLSENGRKILICYFVIKGTLLLDKSNLTINDQNLMNKIKEFKKYQDNKLEKLKQEFGELMDKYNIDWTTVQIYDILNTSHISTIYYKLKLHKLPNEGILQIKQLLIQMRAEYKKINSPTKHEVLSFFEVKSKFYGSNLSNFINGFISVLPSEALKEYYR